MSPFSLTPAVHKELVFELGMSKSCRFVAATNPLTYVATSLFSSRKIQKVQIYISISACVLRGIVKGA